MPTQLHRFLVGLLTGNPQHENPSESVSNLIQSFGQDLIYAVTCGQHKPPKHVLLPYAIKTLTGNTEIIRTLNKSGHRMSYTQDHPLLGYLIPITGCLTSCRRSG